MEVDGVPLVVESPGEFFWGDEEEKQEDRTFWEQALGSLALPGGPDRGAADGGYLDDFSDLLVGETDLFLDCGTSEEYGSPPGVEQERQEGYDLWDGGSVVHRSTTGREDVNCGTANRLVEDWFVPQSGTGCSQEVEEDRCLDEITLSPRFVHPETKVTNASQIEDVCEQRRPSTGRKRSRAAGVSLESLDTGESGGTEEVEVNFQATPSSSGEEIADASFHNKGGAVTRSNVQTPTSSPEEDGDSKRQIRLLRNRESASQSRARKKSYVKDLEVRCRMLENHVSQLQRAMTVSAMENMALRQELVRAKKLKDSGSKSGVAEPAVLESNSLPLEFLPHHSYQCPMGHQYHTGGRCHGWLLALVQLLLLTVVRESNMSQGSPQQLHEAHSSSPFWPMSHSVGFEALTSRRAIVCSAFPNPGHRRKRRRIISGLQFFEHFRALNAPVPHVRPLFKQKRYQVKRRIKRLLPGRSGRKALH